ncbi:MAG TPA: pitrilysin family protein [Fimbriiglobus sp.]|jgi:predicted Zn-dependent peptidase
MPFSTHHLANGLTLVGETLPTSRSVAVGFYVRTGARDEVAAESGVSHFLEHMMFKGTPKRTALEVNLDFDRIGANYNAFTSEEVTAYYAAVLPEYLPNAVDVLADILRPSLRQADFDTEKQVILEEIGMYEDMPTSAAFDKARIAYFQGHPLGNSVLGTKESVGALTRDQMQAYFDRRYAAANVVCIAAGRFDFADLGRLLEEKCGEWSTGTVGRQNVTPVPGAGGVHVYPKDGIAQEQVILLSPGPDAQSPLRYAASVLAVAIGDETGSRYYWGLVDPGHCDGASCSVDPNEGSGAFVSLMTCEPDAAKPNLGMMREILSEMQKAGLSADELAAAKSKIASRVIRGSERPMGRMRAHAGSWIYRAEPFNDDTELARFDAVTREAVRDVLDQFPVDSPTVVAYGPVAQLT